jgi:uncharacterized protein
MDYENHGASVLAQHVSQFAGEDAPDIGIKLVSADSHITEPPNCYIDYIDPAFRDRAPTAVIGPNGGHVFAVDGIDKPIPLGIIAAAGIDPKEMAFDKAKFDEIHRGGWDPAARLLDQDRDGVVAEVIYPSVGMILCNHPDIAYKHACFTAYNRWLSDFCSHAPNRLFGIGQTAAGSPEQVVADMETFKHFGFKGVMLPGEAPIDDFDYDDPRWDRVWKASVEMDLPISFHILTSGKGKSAVAVEGRGSDAVRVGANQHSILRANQDNISLLIWGRAFERNPDLKVVCVEADAGWAPHFMYRLDHFYNRHRFWSKMGSMPKLPSEYFHDNIYLTFQDDYIAFRTVDLMNEKRLMWANDFPHSDSTWPWSRQMLKRHVATLTEEQKQLILRDNVIELYNLENVPA